MAELIPSVPKITPIIHSTTWKIDYYLHINYIFCLVVMVYVLSTIISFIMTIARIYGFLL